MDSVDGGGPPANDAQLIQNVRSALGRDGSSSRLNVSSCGFVITLHGTVRDEGCRRGVEMQVRRVGGVCEVENKLRVQTAPRREACFPSPDGG